MTTLLLEPAVFDADQARIQGDAYRHLFRARRLAVGDRLRVTDGEGRARWSRVAGVDRHTATLELGEAAPSAEPALRLTLLVATPRLPRATWLVEKVTELGAVAVRFVAAERAPRSYGAAQLQRLRRVAAGAVEQCERSVVPEITGIHGWEEVAALSPATQVLWCLDPTGRAAARLVVGVGSEAGLAVGPEGGWTDAERRTLEELGYRPVGLGQRILRVETAAVAGTALLLAAPENGARAGH